MVQLWAEKEVRNLKRLSMTEGLIKSPRPYLLKNNVIVMEFIGENGIGAPRLKDANIPSEEWQQVYVEVLFIMRRMYHLCKLVHADFSEYNMLYYKGEVWVIDVSQSVEHDHPMALDFLRRDCGNINDFFKRKGLHVLNTQQCFDFITDINIANENDYLTGLFTNTSESMTMEQQITDNVFMNIYIPRTLQELSLEEIEKLKKENNQEMPLYGKLTGMGAKSDNEEEEDQPAAESPATGVVAEEKGSDEEDGSDNEEASGDEGSQSGGSEDEDGDEDKKHSVSLRGMTQDQKKEHKKKIKEENREKRKTKIPKHIKKKAEKKNKK